MLNFITIIRFLSRLEIRNMKLKNFMLCEKPPECTSYGELSITIKLLRNIITLPIVNY